MIGLPGGIVAVLILVTPSDKRRRKEGRRSPSRTGLISANCWRPARLTLDCNIIIAIEDYFGPKGGLGTPPARPQPFLYLNWLSIGWLVVSPAKILSQGSIVELF